MEILGVGPLEALFVLLIALVVVGPSDLGKAARSAGRMLNRLYRSEAWRQISEASRNLRTLPNRLAREAALEELDQVRKDLREEVTRELRTDLGIKPPPGKQSEPDSTAGDHSQSGAVPTDQTASPATDRSSSPPAADPNPSDD